MEDTLKFTWDLAKSDKNKADPNRLKGFDEALALWTLSLVAEATLNVNSGEQVYLRAGRLDGKVWGAMYVIRGEEIRILSFRRLNERERKDYGFEGV